MNIARYDLAKEMNDTYPDSVYVMTYDDGSARIFRKDRRISVWRIYKSFDEAAAVIKKMTDYNIYTLARIWEPEDPWTHYAREHNAVAVRYDYTMMSQARRWWIAECDRWHRQAGIILKNHYYKESALFDDSEEMARIDAMPCPF